MTTIAKIRVLAELALLLVVVVLVANSYVQPPRVAVGEVVGPNESTRLSQVIDSGTDLIATTRAQVGDGLYRRDAHAKNNGCARATFTVYPTTDARILHGLFHDAKSYKAWIRYSNSQPTIQNDWIPDARGMAIKVLGVPGEKMLDFERNDQTQDFVMVNNAVFVVRDIDDYATMVRYMAQDKLMGFFFESPNPFTWKLRELRLSMQILKLPRNLLAHEFQSLTAYRLGTGNYVKYGARPVPCGRGASVPSMLVGFGRDALRKSLHDQLKKTDAKFCYDFMVQFQVPEDYMPVEDVTIEWSQRKSPFIPVARIEIGQQDIDEAFSNNFCESISMSPWHTLPDHEPVGGLNRARRIVYQNISRYRRCMNGPRSGYGEPLDDGSMRFNSATCDPREAVPAVGANPAPHPPSAADAKK